MIEQDIRQLLAEATGLPQSTVDALPAGTPLFGSPLGLSSRTGVTLLAAVKQRYGVDVVAEDLTLDSLESIATLTAYVAARQ